jgi:hypothetical protein
MTVVFVALMFAMVAFAAAETNDAVGCTDKPSSASSIEVRGRPDVFLATGAVYHETADCAGVTIVEEPPAMAIERAIMGVLDDIHRWWYRY